jgi:hypothetical protein
LSPSNPKKKGNILFIPFLYSPFFFGQVAKFARNIASENLACKWLHAPNTLPYSSGIGVLLQFCAPLISNFFGSTLQGTDWSTMTTKKNKDLNTKKYC